MGKIIDFFKKHPIIKTLVLMIIVFFLLIALTLYGLKLYTRHGKAVIVPEVKTMILPDALRILDREGFRYDIIDSLFIDGAVPGSVIEQTPAGKTQNVPSEYPDLVIGIQYKGENLEQGDKIPAGSSLTLLVGDGIPEEYPDSTIDEIPQNAEEAPLTDESWFN